MSPLQELIKQKEQLESEERETTERVWRTRRAILDKVTEAAELLSNAFFPQTKSFRASASLLVFVTAMQKAELEALEQQRGGVDRESAMLAEEVQPRINTELRF